MIAGAPAFAARVAARRQVGVERHAPQFLAGPCLLRPVALEAIDAANYAVMELARLTRQYPIVGEHDGLARREAHDTVKVLAHCCIDYARRTARLLASATDEHVDVAAVAVERLSGPAAGEYDFAEYLYRPSNLVELVDELADAHILCGFEVERRQHQGASQDSLTRLLIDSAAATAAALGVWTLQIDCLVQRVCPPPAVTARAA